MNEEQKTQISVTFDALYRTEDAKRFQEEGHFRPALRELDFEGNEDFRKPERPWAEDATAHILRIPAPGDPDQSIVRVIYDSREGAEKRIQAVVPTLLAGLWAGSFARREAEKAPERKVLRTVIEALPEIISDLVGLKERCEGKARADAVHAYDCLIDLKVKLARMEAEIDNA